MQEVAKNIFVETEYDDVNVCAILTPAGIICIDVPTYARDARDWAARLHRLSPYSVQQIILTSSHGDRVLNTRWLNAPIVLQQSAADRLYTFDKKYPQSIVDSLIQRRPHRARELNTAPVERPAMSFSGEIMMYKSGHRIILKHAPGPMDGSSWVLLPNAGLAIVGDSVVVDTHPIVGAPASACWLESLEWLQNNEEYHTIIPGRGPVTTRAAIEPVAAYLRALRDRVSAHYEAGNPRESLAQYVVEFLPQFPTGDLPPEWVAKQIVLSLGNIYDEIAEPISLADRRLNEAMMFRDDLLDE